MTDKQWKQAEEQLPEGAKILRTYNAFKNGELRLAVRIPDRQFEARYVVHFEGDGIRLEHRP